MNHKDQIEAQWRSLSAEVIASMSPAQYREALLQSYKRYLEDQISSREDVALFGKFYEIEVAAPHRRHEQIEKALRVTSKLQDPPPDYLYWGKASYWTIREACQLLCGLDPDRMNDVSSSDAKLLALYSHSIADYFRMLRLLGRELDEGESDAESPNLRENPLAFRWTRVTPQSVLAWAKANDIFIPEQLAGAVAARPEPAGATVSEQPELASKERNNLLRIIAALAKEAGISIEDGQGGASAIEAAVLAAGFDSPKERAIRATLKLARDLS